MIDVTECVIRMEKVIESINLNKEEQAKQELNSLIKMLTLKSLEDDLGGDLNVIRYTLYPPITEITI